MNYRPPMDEVQNKPIIAHQQQPQPQQPAYQSYQRPDAAPAPQYRPNVYQSTNAPLPNANYSQYNAPQPTQQPPAIRPMVQPSPNMNFRPNNGPEYGQTNASPRKELSYQPRPQQYAPVQQQQQQQQPTNQYQQPQYKPPIYNPAPQVSQAPVIQSRPMPNMPAKYDEGEEDGVVSGRISTPPIASSIQLAGYINGTQSARPLQAPPRPQQIEMAKRSDSLRSTSASPEPKFNTTTGSPEQIYSPTLRQSPTQPAFERLASPEQAQPQHHQRMVQFQQPPEQRTLHFDPNNPQNRSPPKVFSPEPHMMQQQAPMYQQQQQRPLVHPTTLDLGQNSNKHAYSPVSLNNLITPTRPAQSPGVTFRLPEETETRKRPDTILKQQVLTPTTETFRRSPMATTPENYPRASNWVNRPRSVDRRYRE